MAVRPGDVVHTVISYGAPHHLVADGPLLSHRRTRAGDRRGAPDGPAPTALGLPAFGRPGEVQV